MSSKPRLYFLVLLLSLTLLLSFFVFRPFIYPLIMAVVFSVIFQSGYRKLLKWTGNRPWLASVLTLLLMFVFIVTPLTLIGWQIFQESQQLYFSISNSLVNNGGIDGFWSGWVERWPILSSLSLDLSSYFKTGLGFLSQNLQAVFSSLAKITVSLFVFLVSLFYLLKDGDKIKNQIINLSPLTKADDQIIIDKIVLALNSVVKGSLTVALIQGLVSSLGFVIFNIPNPILWGALTAIGALIPGVGTAVVVVPAVLYLFFIGQNLSALGLLLWGSIAVGLVDNFIGPKLIGQKAKLHPLLTLLSVLGGLSFFGPIGFILGPLTAVFLLVLVEIYLAPPV